MLLRLTLFSLVTALLALPAVGHAAGTVVPSSTSVATVVPPGGTRTVTLSCAAPAVALSAAVTRLGPAATLRRSMPGDGAGNWSFTFAARRGAGRVAEAELRCVRLALPAGISGARLDVRTRGESRIAIPPGETQPVSIPCGRGYVATGHGLTRGTRGDVRIAAAVPTSTGWRFKLENAGKRAANAGVSARCLKRVVGARRGGESSELRFAIARREFSDVALSGWASFSHRCRRGEFSVATGSEIDALDAIALVRSHAAGGRAATWTFARAGAGDGVTTHLVCLDRGSRFR